MKIEDNAMMGERYNTAVMEVIRVLNEELSLNLFYARDWSTIHNVCDRLGIEFDEDGDIIR